MSFVKSVFEDTERRSSQVVRSVSDWAAHDKAQNGDRLPSLLSYDNNLGMRSMADSQMGEYGLIANIASQANTTNGLGRQTSLQQHAEQYRHNTGWTNASIKVIAQRIASRPMHVARINKPNVDYSPEERGFRKWWKRRQKIRMMRHIKNFKYRLKDTLPGHLKEFHEDLDVLEGHPVLDIVNKPNEIMTRAVLMLNTIASLELTGKCFWWIQKQKKGKFVGQFTIWPVPSSWCEARHTKDQLFAEFIIRPEGSMTPTIVPGDEMAYFYYPDPSNPLNALSPLQSQARGVVADEAIQEAQRRAFANGIFPGLALIVGRHPDVSGVPGVRPILTKEQRGQLMAAVKQQYRGVQHQDEPFIMDGLIEDIKKVSNTPREMEFMQSAKISKERVTQGFGVNPISMGQVEGSNRASSTMADEHLVKVTLNPKIELLSQMLTQFVLPMFDDSPNLVWYIEEDRACDPEFELERALAAMDRGAKSRNEFRQDFLHLPPVLNGDTALVPQTMQAMDVFREDQKNEESQAENVLPKPPEPVAPAAGSGGAGFGGGKPAGKPPSKPAVSTAPPNGKLARSDGRPYRDFDTFAREWAEAFPE